MKKVRRMWASIVKFIVFYVIGNRLSTTKHDLREVREHAADYAESRAALIGRDMGEDLQRLIHSCIGVLIVLLALFLVACWG